MLGQGVDVSHHLIYSVLLLMCFSKSGWAFQNPMRDMEIFPARTLMQTKCFFEKHQSREGQRLAMSSFTLTYRMGFTQQKQ